MHVHTSTGGEEAVQAKEAFEAYAAQHGVYVKHYHGDNGIFKSDKWIQHCQRQKQTYTFCGAHSHHQNGIAEHRIRTLSDSARVQLLHACKHNPGVITAHLWPYALKHANNLFNALPRERCSVASGHILQHLSLSR